METSVILGVGITLIVAIVGGSYHMGNRLGRLIEKTNHIEACIHRIDETAGTSLREVMTLVRYIDEHESQGIGDLRDRIVRIETREERSRSREERPRS